MAINGSIMTPLATIKEGDKVRVKNITGSDAVRKHLESMGFVSGSLVTVIQISFGNMILGIHDSRVAVNRDTAARVMVDPVG